jgi:hypothetical protein
VLVRGGWKSVFAETRRDRADSWSMLHFTQLCHTSHCSNMSIWPDWASARLFNLDVSLWLPRARQCRPNSGTFSPPTHNNTSVDYRRRPSDIVRWNNLFRPSAASAELPLESGWGLFLIESHSFQIISRRRRSLRQSVWNSNLIGKEKKIQTIFFIKSGWLELCNYPTYSTMFRRSVHNTNVIESMS